MQKQLLLYLQLIYTIFISQLLHTRYFPFSFFPTFPSLVLNSESRSNMSTCLNPHHFWQLEKWRCNPLVPHIMSSSFIAFIWRYLLGITLMMIIAYHLSCETGSNFNDSFLRIIIYAVTVVMFESSI